MRLGSYVKGGAISIKISYTPDLLSCAPDLLSCAPDLLSCAPDLLKGGRAATRSR